MHPNLDELLALRDGDGPAAASGHVARCPRCADELAELRAAAAALRSLPVLGPERDHWPEIRRRVFARRRARAVRLVAAAASFAAVVTTTVLTRSPSPTGAPDPSAASARTAVDELAAASRGLEEVLRDPALQRQVLSPRRAAVIIDIEDRIAVVDAVLADQFSDEPVATDVALWSYRVELLDALVAARAGSLGDGGFVQAVYQHEGSQP
jgi:hypothetical protein